MNVYKAALLYKEAGLLDDLKGVGTALRSGVNNWIQGSSAPSQEEASAFYDAIKKRQAASGVSVPTQNNNSKEKFVNKYAPTQTVGSAVIKGATGVDIPKLQQQANTTLRSVSNAADAGAGAVAAGANAANAVTKAVTDASGVFKDTAANINARADALGNQASDVLASAKGTVDNINKIVAPFSSIGNWISNNKGLALGGAGALIGIPLLMSMMNSRDRGYGPGYAEGYAYAPRTDAERISSNTGRPLISVTGHSLRG